MAGLDWLGSALGGLFGLAGSAMNQMMSFKDNKKLQENQARLNYENSVNLSKWSAQNMPSMNRAGLTKAGYNPMLAVQNATGGANAGSFAGTASTQPVDYMSGVSAGVANAQSLQRLKNETAQTESNIKTNEATARNQNAEASNKEAENPFISQREQKNLGKMDAEIAKLNKDTDYTDAMTKNISVQNELQRQLIDTQRYAAGAGYAQAGASYANAKTNRLQYLIDKEVQDIVRDKEKRYKEWGEKHPYWRNVDESISRYFSGFGASLSRSTIKK